MEENSSPQTITCENCSNTVSDQKFCSTCSFPNGGNDDEKMQFRTAIGRRKRLLSEAEDKMKSAKNIIYISAALVFIVGVYQGLANEDYVLMVLNLILCVLYLILAAWSNKNPFGAILTAFILYITLNVINAFFEPTTLFQGIILKIVFIGAFIKGIRSAQEAREHLAELEKVKASPVGNY